MDVCMCISTLLVVWTAGAHTPALAAGLVVGVAVVGVVIVSVGVVRHRRRRASATFEHAPAAEHNTNSARVTTV